MFHHRKLQVVVPFRRITPEALDRLIALYTATNKPGEVQKWQAERAKYPADPNTSPQGKK